MEGVPGIVGHLDRLLQPRIVVNLAGLLLSLGLGLLAFRNSKGSLRLLVIHLAISLYVELLGSLTGRADNQLIFTVYFPFDFWLVLFAARDFLGRLFVPYALSASAIFVGSMVSEIYVMGLSGLPIISMLIYWILLLIAWLLAMLYNVRQDFSTGMIGSYTIAVGILIYYGCSVPVMGMFRFNAIHERVIAFRLQTLMMLASIFRYILVGVGLLLISRAHTSEARRNVLTP